MSYWEKRAAEMEKQWYDDTLELEKELDKLYRRTLSEIRKEMNDYAARFKLSFRELSKHLSKLDGVLFQTDADAYYKRLEALESELAEQAGKEVVTYLDTAKVTRLAAIHFEIDKALIELSMNTNQRFKAHIADGYVRDLVQNKFAFKRMGIETPVYKLDKALINKVVGYPWSGDTFSNRIWTNNRQLMTALKRDFTQGIITGRSIDKITADMAARLQSGKRETMRLVRTESNYFHNQASIDSYKEAGIDRYQVLATLDSRTSPICREQDGKVYPLNKKVVGVNSPPFHPYCRTTTIPYFEDEDGERFARDSNGDPIMVDNITYKEYEKQFLAA
ncbi:minor capsid protein [Paenibacillus alvei]|uniref:minor capsid protein n=1 Tax=Paenibacillus alvei TaxID=44250 RepID=UPI0002886824|nr:minor capsid protein [Paenibacillus alvei]EJW14870.1 SPP1 family phage head morphogenesis protein [Paenibacillus alvei DSM 29]MCY9544735.1 minor capsid protein [Paenibacillus alvei]MCY9708389.1 minor capsid protein [Paenibacillus alvei]MEC0083273.1 minor capsid protein [Paenibacillus alvei]